MLPRPDVHRFGFLLLFIFGGCTPTHPESSNASSDPHLERPSGSTASTQAIPALRPVAKESETKRSRVVDVSLTPQMQVVAPGEEDVAAAVRREMEGARRQGYGTIVYVGATWCEPCERFKDALAEGRLDDTFRGIRFLDFDHDHYADGLRAAGYGGRLVPLFAVPLPDGSASSVSHQGAVRGVGAVPFLVPKLKPLVEAALKPTLKR